MLLLSKADVSIEYFNSKLIAQSQVQNKKRLKSLSVVLAERGSRTYAFRKYHKIANH